MSEETENLHKRYFTQLGTSIKEIVGSRQVQVDLPICNPLAYTYSHNLTNGEFEDVQGVEPILGYKADTFTLQLYYQNLHPEDHSIVFETARKGYKYLFEDKTANIFETYLIITYRIKRKDGRYAHIFRTTQVQEAIEEIPTKTFSRCIDITGLNLRPFVSLKYQSTSKFNFDTMSVVPQQRRVLLGSLTCSELRIVRFLAEGKKSYELAGQLGISVNTINTHRRNILKKTGLKSIIEVICRAQEAGVI